MATTIITLNPQLVTVPANTSEHDLDLTALVSNSNFAEIEVIAVTGTSVQFSNDSAITAASGALTAGVGRMTLPVKRGIKPRFKGGAGSETFIVITRPNTFY